MRFEVLEEAVFAYQKEMQHQAMLVLAYWLIESDKHLTHHGVPCLGDSDIMTMREDIEQAARITTLTPEDVQSLTDYMAGVIREPYIGEGMRRATIEALTAYGTTRSSEDDR